MLRTLSMAFAAVALLPSASACLADTITLRHSVRMESRANAILLRDVAELDGPEAMAFADLEVGSPSYDRVVEISLAEIRRKLQDAGVHWGKLNLNGGRSVTVRPGRAASVEPPLAMSAASLSAGDVASRIDTGRDEQVASAIAGEPTVRGAIANLVVSHVRIDPARVQLGFDRADDDLLRTRTDAARFELHPLGSLHSDRIEMTIRFWEGATVQRSANITIIPMLRIRGASLRHDVQRDHMITESDVVEEDQWLPPGQAQQVIDRVSAIGRIATRRMKAGELLRERSLRRDVVIKSGDPVLVRCLIGGAVISLQAEARADAGHGDLIELRKQGERQTFQATVTGRGEAVLDLSRRTRTSS